MRLKALPVHAVLLASVSVFAVSAAAAPAGPQAAPQQIADAALVKKSTPANQAPAPQSAPAASGGGEADEKVVVTARRVEEQLQDTPVAVSAFSEKQLDRLGTENIGGLQGSVPNMNIVQGRGSNSSANIFIRGVGQPDALQTFDPAVGVYVDDVYISRIRGALFDVYDMSRIEVLRGPQGTLYGKNTIGGALKIITLKPSDVMTARVQAGIGSDDLLEFRARASGPLADNLGFTASLYTADRAGFVTDPVLNRDYNDKDTIAGRVSLFWDFDPSTSVKVSVDYSRETPALTVGRQENTLSVASGTVLVPPPAGEFNFRTRTTAALPNDQNALDHFGASMNVEHEMSEAWTFKSITAGRSLAYKDFIDIDATQFQLGDVLVDVDQSQMSQEFQLAYDRGGAFRFIGGLYGLREEIASHQEAYGNDLFLATTFTRFIDDSLTTTSLAAFASADYDVQPDLTVTLGARLTREGKDYTRSTNTASAGLLGGFLNGLFYAFNVDETWTDFSPNLTMTYRAQENATFYAKVSKGFKSGGMNGRANGALEPIIYDPETLWSYEAGGKFSLDEGRLTVNSAVFFNQYKDFQARVARGDTLTPQFGVINAGALDQLGAELEIFYRPVRALQLQAQLGWLDATYGEFFDPRFAPITDPRNDRSWQTPAFSPELTARLGAVYTLDFVELGLVDVGGDASFRSKMALAVDNADFTTRVEFPGMHQDAYWLFNARVAWTSANGQYTVALIGRNLTDEVYRTDAQEFSNVAGIRTAYYGQPTTYQVNLGINF
jgi:iron complex outermembrane recepter protein